MTFRQEFGNDKSYDPIWLKIHDLWKKVHDHFIKRSATQRFQDRLLSLDTWPLIKRSSADYESSTLIVNSWANDCMFNQDRLLVIIVNSMIVYSLIVNPLIVHLQ